MTTALVISLLRASYETMTRDLLRHAGVRRRAILVGRSGEVSQLRRAIFEPIDRLQAEMTRRYRDGEADIEELLHK